MRLAHLLLLALAAPARALASSAGLTLRIYNNTAASGVPMQTRIVSAAHASHAGNMPFSALMTGSLAVTRGLLYNFSCAFGGAVLGYVHIDGHLVCQTGVNHAHNPAGRDVRSTTYDMPLRALSKTVWPVRFTLVHNGSLAEEISFGVDILRYYSGGNADPAPDDNETGAWHVDEQAQSLSPQLPAVERQRDALQASIAQGWAPWYDMSFTRLVRLPEGSTLTFALCEASTAMNASAIGDTTNARCATEMRTDWGPSDGMGIVLRPGPHAYDRSYMELYAATPTCNVSIVSSGGRELLAKVAVVSGCESTELVIIAGSAWQRLHTEVTAGSKSSLRFVPYGDGMQPSTIHSTVAADGSLTLPAAVAAQPHLALRLRSAQGIDTDAAAVSIGLTSMGALSLREIEARLQSAWDIEHARYEHFGALAEVKMAQQAGVMWNVIYNPIETVIAPVIRGNPWGWDPATVSDDWAYVLFDWDTHFAAYMLSLDAKDLSYSVLIQVVKAKSAKGFVPNGWAPTRKSTHSQPPVGSKVLLELFRKYGDVWLVELLFDDLLDWSDWFHSHRRLAPLNLTALGGDDMQAARYESGLDNSPMYDGEFFVRTEADGYGLMRMWDVGMASMCAMSDEALAELALALGRSDDAARVRERARTMRQQIAAHLWDATSGAFVNLFSNGTFNRRISPTSFYPMLAGAATTERAAVLVRSWLTNASRFCISPSGDPAGNDPQGCYWGLPSISADDPAFPALGYWRGFVWGPMALLTFWSLAHPSVASLPPVVGARAALAKQMGAMFLNQWRRHHHVCENFSPKRDAPECTGMRAYSEVEARATTIPSDAELRCSRSILARADFYHWGGLAGFIGLLEAGFYNTTSNHFA